MAKFQWEATTRAGEKRRGGDADLMLTTAERYEREHAIVAAAARLLGELLRDVDALTDAQLRQFELSDDATFPIGPYTFRPSVKMLINPDTNRKIHLTEKETAILKYLYRMGDRPVAREVLLDEVWGYNAGVTTHTLETHIYRLRQKIEPEPASAQILVTEPGGYRLVR